MPFTTVPDKASGSVFTETNWDTHIRDNLNFLKEVEYQTLASDLTVSATTGAGAQTVVSGTSITYEAVPHLITVSCGRVRVGASGTAYIHFDLWDGGTQLGRLGTIGNNAAALLEVGFERTIRLTPTAAAHTYIWKAWREAANGTVFAGSGGANDQYPAYIRIVRVPV